VPAYLSCLCLHPWCSALTLPASKAKVAVQECGLELDEEKYTASFTPNLMVPLLRWASGATFAQVTEKSRMFEGTLIRCTRRLMELMNQVIFAADKVGEAEMKAQMEAALASLQRGIMFCGSLYLNK
jgi:superfamily II RNA helicase